MFFLSQPPSPPLDLDDDDPLLPLLQKKAAAMILQRLPGMRNRLRISILLAFVFVAVVLIFPFSQHHRLVNVLTFQLSPQQPKQHKNEINLEETVAKFQQEFYNEHDALGKYGLLCLMVCVGANAMAQAGKRGQGLWQHVGQTG